MSDKSYVTLETSACPVCGTQHDTGAVLLDTRLRDKFEHKTCTGWQLCPEHKKLADDGYVALVECSNQPTSLEKANRTGALAHIRRSAWENIFNTPAPKGPLAFVEVGVIAKLQEKVPS
jgi:hypothetical protein